MRLSRLAAFGVLALFVSCTDAPTPSEPPLEPGFLISDAAHNGGNEHFYWLPPMVADPGGFTEAFNGSQSPVVRICEVPATPVGCNGQPLLAEFTTSTGPGSETVRVVPADEHYIVNWHTDQFDVDPGEMYRISAHAFDEVLGYADVQLAASGGEANNITTGEIIGLVDGRTLPIKFRIEQGAAAETFTVDSDVGGTVASADGSTSIDIPPGALADDTDITIEPVDPVGEAIVARTFGPAGTEFIQPVTATLAYDPAALSQTVSEDDLAFNLLDGVGRWVVVPNYVLNTTTKEVSADLFGFSTGGAGPAALAIFCPGDPDSTTYELLADAIAAVMDGGTVEVCPGTHTVQDVAIEKPVTIEGQAGARPTLTTGGAQFGLKATQGPSQVVGTITIRNLRLLTDFPNAGNRFASALFIGDWHDQILVDDVDLEVLVGGSGLVSFDGQVTGSSVTIQNATAIGPGGHGVLIFLVGGSSTLSILNSSFSNFSQRDVLVQQLVASSTRVTVDNITATGGGVTGVFALNTSGAAPGPLVDVLNSSFTNKAIWFQQGAAGLIQNNTFNGCHPVACIRVTSILPHTASAEPPRIIGNQITLPSLAQTQWGIYITDPVTGPYEVRDNQLGGPPPVMPRTDSVSYGFGVGIRIGFFQFGPQAAGVVTGNTISSAHVGIRTEGGTGPVTGLDNTIDQVWTAFSVTGTPPGTMSIQSSDITDYVVPIDPGQPFNAGDLTCNWWGDVNGPVGVDPGIAPAVFTPWAIVPVAGTSTTSC